MNTVSEEQLLAWLDGELDQADAAIVARAVATDPALGERVRSERVLRERLRGAFAPTLDEPVPRRLLATLGTSEQEAAPPQTIGNVAQLRPRNAVQRVADWRGPEFGALAASVLLGVLFGMQFLRDPVQAPMRMHDGSLVANAGLAQVLDTKLAADVKDGDTLEVGLSFRDAEGNYCRTFTVQLGRALGGLACRDSGQWHVIALGEAGRQDGQLRLAASALPASVLTEVDARQKELLDASAERAARDSGWR